MRRRVCFRPAGYTLLGCLVVLISATGHINAEESHSASQEVVPELPEITWKGITIYGSVDVGLQYESHGVPVGPKAASSAGIILPSNRGPQVLIAPNQLTQSGIGLKLYREIGQGFSLVGKADTGYIPTTLLLSDTIGSIRQQNGVPTTQQTASFDGPRAGQAFNGELSAGVSHPWYGTLSYGRQTTFTTENILSFDPLASYGFSLLGYIGTFGGAGAAELVRVDQSVKYSNSFGPFHIGVMFAAPDTSVKKLYQFEAGLNYEGFALDAVLSRGEDNVAVGALSGIGNIGSPFVGARIFNSDAIQVFARYDHQIDGVASVSFHGGWEQITFSNPTDGGYGVGHTIIGGYFIGPAFSVNGLTGGGIVNYAYTGGERTLSVVFGAIKYQFDSKTSLSAGVYHVEQNSFGFGVSRVSPAAGLFYSSTPCNSNKFTNCRGSEDLISGKVEHRYNRNITFYAGSTFSIVYGGLAFGYLKHQELSLTSGVRLSF